MPPMIDVAMAKAEAVARSFPTRKYRTISCVTLLFSFILVFDINNISVYLRRASVDVLEVARLKEECGDKCKHISNLMKEGKQDNPMNVLVVQSNAREHGSLDTNFNLKHSKAMITTSPSEKIKITHQQYDVTNGDRRAWMSFHGRTCYPETQDVNLPYRKFDALIQAGLNSYAHELWKYCHIYVLGGAFLDHESPLLEGFYDSFPILRNKNDRGSFGGINYAVMGDAYPGTIHGSLLVMDDVKSIVAKGMVNKIVHASVEDLMFSPFVLPKALYKLIAKDLGLKTSGLPLSTGFRQGENGVKWMILKQTCHTSQDEGTKVDSFLRKHTSFWNNAPQSVRMSYMCATGNEYCCEISDPCSSSPVMVSHHPVLPHQFLPSSAEKPYLNHMNDPTDVHEMDDEKSKQFFFISTIREEKSPDLSENLQVTPNFYEMLKEGENLPDSECLKCLNDGSCESCSKCENYCGQLCHVHPEPKFIRKSLIVTPPPYAKEPSRLIPRIIHQTWQQGEMSKRRFPNLSRMVESWKTSSWEYRYYDEEKTREFLKTHFPEEVLQTYDDLRPGPFKADLFRYCVLLVHGGVYVDMDVMLESNLDEAIPSDVGFMLGTDYGPCLWNGFIASAPAHSFLAIAIETTVNNVRNRFTRVDIDDSMCPDVNFESVHKHLDKHQITGSCVLGGSVNKVMNRHPQSIFNAGDDFVAESAPGRTIILSKKAKDMDSTRLTFLEKNMIVATTDFPGVSNEFRAQGSGHFDGTNVENEIYGVSMVYANQDKANEDIKLIIKSGEM